ncbi:hypothetical protein OAP63_00910 [Vibrio sp.]|nr:hypothetical protein [Vibrio sp.]
MADSQSNEVQHIVQGSISFRQYCSGCHSIQRQSYEDLARLAGWNDKAAKKQLMLSSSTQITERNLSALPDESAKASFGIVPPDLSLYVTQHGPKYLYHFLTGFYPDQHARFGVNNKVAHNTLMPDILGPLQNTMSKESYHKLVSELVSYLSYTSDPSTIDREGIGVGVLVFLSLLLALCWLLKKEYWRDVE